MDAAYDDPPIPPPPAPRIYAGWVVLWALFALLILSQLAIYFGVGEPPLDKADKKPGLSTFRAAVLQQRISERLSPMPTGKAYADALAKELAQIRKGGIESIDEAQAVVVIAREAGHDPATDALTHLRGSKDAEAKAFLSLYEAGKVTSDSDKVDPYLRKWAKGFGEGKDGKAIRREMVPDNQVALILVVLTVALAGLALGVVLLLYGVIRVGQGDWKPVRYPMPLPDRLRGDTLAVRMVIFFLLFLTVPVAFAMLRGTISSAMLGLLAMLALAGLLVASLSLRIGPFRSSLSEVIGRRDKWLAKVLLGVAGWLANLPIALGAAVLSSMLLQFLPAPSHPVVEDVASATGIGPLLALFALTSLVVPFAEELSFRGLLFPSFLPFMRPVAAMLLSGFLFAAIHPQGPILWLSLASVGSVAAFLTYQSGSLIPAITMHAFHNFSLLLMNRLIMSG